MEKRQGTSDRGTANPYRSPQTLAEEAIASAAAQKAYRRAALPFGLFMIACGVGCGLMAFALPAHAVYMPPLETEIAKRLIFFAIACAVLGLGVGFVRRRIWALYAFVAYVAIGTALHVLLGIIEPAARPLLASPLFNLPVGYVIYRMCRPAFAIRDR